MSRDDTAARDANALPAGFEFEGYRIDRVLGAGGFGITYLARDLATGRRAAIKEYLPHGVAKRDADGRNVRPLDAAAAGDFAWGLDRFRAKAATLTRLRHPNIVAALRFFSANGTAYLVMDYVDGESLAAVLGRRSTLDEAELRRILAPLLDGLEAVHRLGYLHRDIKPGNIFIRRGDGQPVLLDFGSARQAMGEAKQGLTVIVSHGFAPFEQYATKGALGPWTDVYAIGATLYQAAFGEVPPTATDRVDAAMGGRPDPLVPARERGAGRFSESFLAGIDAALAVQARDRPQSVAALKAMFGEAGGAEAGGAEARPVAAGSGSAATPAASLAKPPPSFGERLKEAVVTPVRALRWRYVPLLMVYFAYGVYASLPAVALSFWRRQSLTLTPAELAAIAVWLSLPWTIKMVFGQFVDAIPLFGSRRKSYVYLGGLLIAGGFVLLAGAAGQWITFANAETLYVVAMLSLTLGVVLQDVVADAMSTEVVSRTDAAGRPRPQSEVNAELAMVQVLGRLALLFGLFATAGLGGYLAKAFTYEQVFLIALVVPVISVTGVVLVRLETGEPGAIDWRVLGGGLAFGAAVVALGVLKIPYGQEIVFLVSLTVIGALLVTVTAELDRDTRLQILFATIVIFAFRATPSTGEGYTWFQMDVLKFDEDFFGHLSQLSSTFAILGMWLLSATIVRQPIARTMLWLTVIYTILSFPNLALYYGLHEWTERSFGFGARTIALIDTAAESPFAQLSMIPLLTLIAIYAPPGKRATWFALMASLLNLALTAGALQTKYLNQIFHIGRNEYAELGWLLITVIVLNFVVPILAIALFGHRIAARKA